MQCLSCGKETNNHSTICNECERKQSGKESVGEEPTPVHGTDKDQAPVLTFFRQNGLKILLVIIVIILLQILLKR